MKTLDHLIHLYEEAFKAIHSFVLRYAYRMLFWFCFVCYLIVLYAFVYRIATGFPFD